MSQIKTIKKINATFFKIEIISAAHKNVLKRKEKEHK